MILSLLGLAGWTGLTGQSIPSIVAAWVPKPVPAIPTPAIKPVGWVVLKVPPRIRKGPVKLVLGQPLPGFDQSVTLIRDVDALMGKFAAIGYDLGAVRNKGRTVPRVYLSSLPDGLPDVPSAKQRKRAFLQSILPLVLQENDVVAKQRDQLKRALVAGPAMTAAQKVWLGKLAKAYGVDDGVGDGAELLRRVDTVPPSLALAQAAEESGWGRSRFAMQGNAVFGQWTYKKGTGLVPTQRDTGKRHEVRAFADLRSSVGSYLRNLNTHWAYKDFRQRRAELRVNGEPLTGLNLIPTLTRYSERGEKYVETLRGIISYNRLHELDKARLSDTATRL